MLCLNELGDAISMYGGTPLNANWKNRDFMMTQLTDVMSHPEYRHITIEGKRLFILTAEHFFDIFSGPPSNLFYYGFPGERSSRVGIHHLSYSKIAEGGIYLSTSTHKFKNSFLFGFGSVSKQTEAKEDFNKFWKEAKSYYPFSIVRDSKFLKWRFFDKPDQNYQVYIYKNIVGNILAYAIISIRNKKATLVDVLALPNKKVIQNLFYAIGKDIQKSGVLLMQSWLPRKHFVVDYLIQIGFEENVEPLGIIPTGRSFDESLDINFAKNNIYYTMGDGDLF
jgi:hypothetical protein